MATQPATLVPQSANAKLGKCATTLLAQSTCPATCPFLPRDGKNNGCYANAGNSRFHTSRLNSAAATPEQAAALEVSLLRQHTWSDPKTHLPLRLHVVGDFVNVDHLRKTWETLQNYSKPIWGYTHAWPKWFCMSHLANKLSVLASCHTWEEVTRAYSKGYAPALTVDNHPDNGKAYKSNGFTVIPCPNQTRGITCDKCKLCWNAQGLHDRRAIIAFALHGAHKQAAAALGNNLVQIGPVAV